MKRFVIIVLLLIAFLLPVNYVSAEEVNEPEITEEQLTEKISDYLSQYLDSSLVAQIITWLVDAGVLTSLLAIAIKYGKYKKSTVEDVIGTIKSEVGKHLKESFNDLSVDEIKKITGSINDLENSIETIMKVLVLMQDSSIQGKAALIDFLGSKTKSEEVKKSADEVKVVLEEEQALKDEVVSKVSDDYKDIF